MCSSLGRKYEIWVSTIYLNSSLSTLTLISCVKVLCIEQLNIENCHYGHVSAIHAHTHATPCHHWRLNLHSWTYLPCSSRSLVLLRQRQTRSPVECAVPFSAVRQQSQTQPKSTGSSSNAAGTVWEVAVFGLVCKPRASRRLLVWEYQTRIKI
jgi:hypothetical protein